MILRKRNYHIHFTGIGGVGMSGIAEVLFNQGYAVTGSDIKHSATIKRLEGLGMKIFIGHQAENIKGSDVLVYSSAVSFNNPEVRAAASVPIPIIPRAEMLSELMRMKFSIAIGGAHGKTTTSSMIAWAFAEAGLDPTIIVGGRLKALGTNARLGKSDYLVAEADESDGSFLKLLSTIAVITNIDREHMDHYRTMKNLEKAFIEFANKVPFYGLTVLCYDCPRVQGIMPYMEKRFVTYGFDPRADYRATDIKHDGFETSFDVWFCQSKLGRMRTRLLGDHNVLNSLATLAVCEEVGIPISTAEKALETFTGIGRRFEVLTEARGVMVVDDYGHHPTEIKETLNAARVSFPKRKIIAVFQPHRYTRAKDLARQFAKAFGVVDELIVTEIYPAGEEPIAGVNAKMIASLIEKVTGKEVEVMPYVEEIAEVLYKRVKTDDIVVTFGAGDVNKAGYMLKEMLEKSE